MKTFKSLLRFIIIILILQLSINFTSVFSQVKVLPVDKVTNYSGNGGLYYALPRTVIHINVKVIQTDSHKGPYSAFAKKYLGVENDILYTNTTYEINSVKICTFSEPDPDNIYFVEIPDEDSKNDKEVSVSLSKSGVIQAVNDDFITSKSLTNCCEEDYEVEPDLLNKKGDKDIFNEFIISSYFESFDTIIKVVIIDDTTTIEEKILKPKLITKTKEQKAAGLAQKLKRIQSDKNNLLTGYQEVAYSKESIEYMYDRLQEMEDDILDLFRGVKVEKLKYYSFDYIPQKENPANADVVFKFSPSKGVLDKAVADGDEVKLIFDNSGIANRIKEMSGQGTITNDGFYYRLPEYSDVKVEYSGRKLAETRILIEQFGSLTMMPPNKSKVQYHKNSGSIKRFEIE